MDLPSGLIYFSAELSWPIEVQRWFVFLTQQWIDNDLIWIEPIAQIKISWINFVKVFNYGTKNLAIIGYLIVALMARCKLQLSTAEMTQHTENFAPAHRFIGCWPWECFGSHIDKLSFSVMLNFPKHQSLQVLHISASHPSTEASPWPLDATHGPLKCSNKNRCMTWRGKQATGQHNISCKANKVAINLGHKHKPHVGQYFYSRTSPPILKIPSTRVQSYLNTVNIKGRSAPEQSEAWSDNILAGT